MLTQDSGRSRVRDRCIWDCFHARAPAELGDAMIVDILIVVLVLMLIGSLPSWPYSRNWGYYGTGGVGGILLLVVLLLLLHVF